MVPTPEAEPVLRRVRFLLGELAGLAADLRDTHRRRPLVRIGAVPHAMLGVMQDFAAHWSGKEGVRLRLEDGPTSVLVEKLLRGDLDAIVAPLTPEAGPAFTSAVRSRPLYSESIVIATSVKNPLAKAKSVAGRPGEGGLGIAGACFPVAAGAGGGVPEAGEESAFGSD